jgi:hypothetical protein
MKWMLVREFSEGLCRMSFVYGAIEWDKPFLGPLHAFVAVQAPCDCVPLPLFVCCILSWLRDNLRSRRSVAVREIRKQAGVLFRVDAKAECDVVCVGGWEPARNAEDQVSTKCSRWFSMTLEKHNAQWAFFKRAPFKTISALERFSSLIALILFDPADLKHGCRDGIVIRTCFTDSQVAARVVGKQLTIKFALGLVNMELLRSWSCGDCKQNGHRGSSTSRQTISLTGFSTGLKTVCGWLQLPRACRSLFLTCCFRRRLCFTRTPNRSKALEALDGSMRW